MLFNIKNTKIMVDFKKLENLENEISKKSFHKANKSKNNTWYFTSLTFQLLNIIICFFGLYLFLSKVIDTFPAKMYIIGSISMIILFFWEKLKREQLRTTTISFLREKKEVSVKQIPNFLITIFLIICSSLIAIQGGKELSDKQEKIETKFDNKLDTESDSINIYYENKIKTLESRVEYIYSNAKDRKGDTRPLTTFETNEVKEIDNKVKELKSEKDKELNKLEEKVNNKKNKHDNKNENIVVIFIISSIVFELFIIIGVCFTSIYDFMFYTETTNDENFKKRKLFLDYIDLIYENGRLTRDDKVVSENKFYNIIKLKYRNNTGNFKEFIYIISFLKITITRKDKRKYFGKTYEEATQSVNEYFDKL